MRARARDVVVVRPRVPVPTFGRGIDRDARVSHGGERIDRDRRVELEFTARARDRRRVDDDARDGSRATRTSVDGWW